MLMNHIKAQLLLHRWADTVGQWAREAGTKQFVLSTLSGSVYLLSRRPDRRVYLRQLQGDTLQRLWADAPGHPVVVGGYSDVKSRKTTLHLVFDPDGARERHTLETSQVYGVANA